MIKFNLAVLMAERDIKMAQIARETDISRTTLNSLVDNQSQGIQLDIINKLCIYLKVTPEQFFIYVPFDVSVKVIGQFELEIELEITENEISQKFYLLGRVESNTGVDINGRQKQVKTVNLSFLRSDMENGREALIKYLDRLPITFIQDIKVSIIQQIASDEDKHGPTATTFSIDWRNI